MKLSIGMATYDDYDGLYFTIQSLRMYQDVTNVEFIVVDNFGCDYTENLITSNIPGGVYIKALDTVGTAAPRDLIFKVASGDIVMCMDCHVMLHPGAISRLVDFYGRNPDCMDLLQGPLVVDSMNGIYTHFKPEWRDHMWGTWATDERGLGIDGEPFDIPMQGLGLFCCRKDAWPGFNPNFRGFGGEEGYIHEKFRKMGRRTLCAPWLRWLHRFDRPYGVSYPLSIADKVRNYLIGHDEVGLDIREVFAHFSQYLSRDILIGIAEGALGKRDYGHYFQ